MKSTWLLLGLVFVLVACSSSPADTTADQKVNEPAENVASADEVISQGTTQELDDIDVALAELDSLDEELSFAELDNLEQDLTFE